MTALPLQRDVLWSHVALWKWSSLFSLYTLSNDIFFLCYTSQRYRSKSALQWVTVCELSQRWPPRSLQTRGDPLQLCIPGSQLFLRYLTRTCKARTCSGALLLVVLRILHRLLLDQLFLVLLVWPRTLKAAQDMALTLLLHHIIHQAKAIIATSAVSISTLWHLCGDFDSYQILITLFFLVGATTDDVYHNQEDPPPPFEDNEVFDFGLDNKMIRRAFIRKVRRHLKLQLGTVGKSMSRTAFVIIRFLNTKCHQYCDVWSYFLPLSTGAIHYNLFYALIV